MTPRRTPPKAPVVLTDLPELPAPARPGQLREARTALMRQFDSAHRILDQLRER